MDRLGCIIRFHLYTGTKIQKVYTLLPHEAGLYAKRNTHGPNRTNIFNGCQYLSTRPVVGVRSWLTLKDFGIYRLEIGHIQFW